MEKYEYMELEVIEFSAKDVITESTDPTIDTGNDTPIG